MLGGKAFSFFLCCLYILSVTKNNMNGELDLYG